jgi:hypothetical protein
MGVPKPLRNVRIVKKRVKKFIRHQSDRYVKVKVRYIQCVLISLHCMFVLNRLTGGSPEVLTTGCADASRVST